MSSSANAGSRLRRALRIRGTVQAVGLRPTVHRLATRLGLDGFVKNDGDGVWIEIEGGAEAVARFREELRASPPPLARIDHIDERGVPPDPARGFRVLASDGAAASRTRVPPDAAPCADCLRELFDPGDRRHRYPFINCTACGPRYTLVRDLPYDRARTTMAAFALCAACRDEYEDPSDRRFHAEPSACPACGPRLRLVSLDGEAQGGAALDGAARLLRAGAILAIKGVGGFLLAVDAADEAAVARLRARKRRPHKPFALVGRDLPSIETAVLLDEPARAALRAPARPLLLARARSGGHLAPRVAPSVAPGLVELAVALPPTPLHHLLLADGPPLQVMTSGNRAGEPIAVDDAAALARLGGIADAFLLHDRAIHTRCDDSVVRVVAGAVQPVRRARGFAPDPISLAALGLDDAPPVLAVGAQQKGAVCLTRGAEAFLSQHLGDLDHPECADLFVETIGKLGRLLDVRPALVAHDLHPDYFSSRWAFASGLRRAPVQHHHAHVAACLAEHGRVGPAIGVAFDGTGCGPDGALWGGEFLGADLAGFRRVAHLRSLPLPGGAAAIREPFRLAVAALLDAGEPLDLLGRIDPRRLDAIAALVAEAPRSSGAGRWFDAAAALCAVRDAITYDAQAAVELEALAAPSGAAGSREPYPFFLDEGAGEIDLRPSVRALAADLRRGMEAEVIAARVYETMARTVAAGCRAAREVLRLETVALSGGCFQSALLTERCAALLDGLGFEVLLHRRVPPNDGGIAFGQAAVAAYRAVHGEEVRRVPGDPG